MWWCMFGRVPVCPVVWPTAISRLVVGSWACGLSHIPDARTATVDPTRYGYSTCRSRDWP